MTNKTAVMVDWLKLGSHNAGSLKSHPLKIVLTSHKKLSTRVTSTVAVLYKPMEGLK